MSQALNGAPVAVTATSSGTLTPPASNNALGWAVVSNVSPWVCVLGCADGAVTVQPFEQVLVDVTSIGQMSYTMSVPPGGSASAASAQPLYLQADWYVQASGAPSGVWPLSLTAQAIAAFAQFAETLLGTSTGSTLTVTLPAGTQSLIIDCPSPLQLSSVIGATTGQDYGQTSAPIEGLAKFNRYVMQVDIAADAQVTVAMANPTHASWSVLASTGVTTTAQTIDYAVTAQGKRTGFLAQVGGQDGSANVQPIGVSTQGAAVPSDILLVGGSDGTDIWQLATDGAGQLKVLIEGGSGGTVTANQGTPAVPANKWPMEIVDSAGVNVAAVTAAGAQKVDGSAVTQPVSIAATVNTQDAADGTDGAAVPPKVLQVGGATSGDLLEALLVDADGSLVVDATQKGNVPVNIAAGLANPLPVSLPAAQLDGVNVRVNLEAASVANLPPLAAGQAVELLDSAGVNKASISAAGAVKVDGSAVTQPVSLAAGVTQGTTPWATQDAATGATGSAVPADAIALGANNGGNLVGLRASPGGQLIVVGNTAAGAAPNTNPVLIAGSDATEVRTLLTDAGGRAAIVGAAPIASNGVGAPVQIAGQDSGSKIRGVTVGVAGAPAGPNLLQIGGTDGTNGQILLLDTSGRILLPPATTSDDSGSVAITTAASSSAFGSTAAQNAKSWTLCVVVGAATVTTAGFLNVQLETTAGIIIASALVYLPLTVSIPATGLAPISLSGTFGDGGLTVPANAGKDWSIKWSYTTAVVGAITAVARATVGY